MPLYFRCDAGPLIGTGHLMRCLALAQAWQDKGGHCIFLTAAREPLLERLRNEGFEVRTLEQPFPNPADLDITRKTVAEQPGCWLVLDGYHFDSAYQQALRACGARLLVIDDEGHLPIYHADIILNQNLHADTINYTAAGARTLLGTRFALLRRDFMRWKDWQRPVAERAQKILVTMGGADPDNVTCNVIKAFGLLGGEGWEAKVIVGAANPHIASLESAARKCHFPVRLERAVRDMPALMAWADIAVSAAGSTCWELCFMGLPGVLFVLAANQMEVARTMHEKQVAINLGRNECIDVGHVANCFVRLASGFGKRVICKNAGRGLVDGLGGERVVEQLTQDH